MICILIILETTKTSGNKLQSHQDVKPNSVRDRSQIPTIELIKSDDDEDNTETQLVTEKEAGFLKNLYDYQGGTFMSNIDNLSRPPTSSSDAQLNTLFGVYLPCVQNIIGVIVFIRLYWVIGVSGILQGMIIIGLCCLCTFLTTISLAASNNMSIVSIDLFPVSVYV